MIAPGGSGSPSRSRRACSWASFAMAATWPGLAKPLASLGVNVGHAVRRDADCRPLRLEPLAVGNQLEDRVSLDAGIIVAADPKSGLVVVGQEQRALRRLSFELIGEDDLKGLRSLDFLLHLTKEFLGLFVLGQGRRHKCGGEEAKGKYRAVFHNQHSFPAAERRRSVAGSRGHGAAARGTLNRVAGLLRPSIRH